jgi:hypothetical protein
VSHPRRTRRSREKDQQRTTKIHQTVRWCTGLSGEPTVDHEICGRRVAAPIVGRGTGLFGVHRTMSGAPTGPELQRSTVLDLEGNHAPDCLVRRSTEGKDGLPSLPPMAPRCLGAIKGTPRRMEE